ncbi:MAG: zinc dependent phospholipase C family protein [Anaerolineae bacterium]|jgi:hypothetical protein
MAPFLTHLVIGERVWDALDRQRPVQERYGTFLFGCLAPDVDKLCDGLEQSTTHFVGKDEAGTYAWRRSQRFLEHQQDFLRSPFAALEANEQSFVLGYLCHVATDEATARFAMDQGDQLVTAARALPSVDAVLTAMDPRFWAMTTDSESIVAALEAVVIPDGTFIFTPQACLIAMHQIVVPQVREGGGLVPYLNMVRRQRQWVQHGRVSDAADDPALEEELDAYRRQIEAGLPASEQLLETMDLRPFVDEAVHHSLQRLHTLLAEGRLP